MKKTLCSEAPQSDVQVQKAVKVIMAVEQYAQYYQMTVGEYLFLVNGVVPQLTSSIWKTVAIRA